MAQVPSPIDNQEEKCILLLIFKRTFVLLAGKSSAGARNSGYAHLKTLALESIYGFGKLDSETRELERQAAAIARISEAS
jgi:hypothetical protein